ncbi:Phosphotransferase KptA/Tpt1 [Trinorchestia longiramus]|nr:Phosphotransferase KptA/Tpt1 [Trinorchestia longiramus]
MRNVYGLYSYDILTYVILFQGSSANRRGPGYFDPCSRQRESDQYQRSWSSAAQKDSRANNGGYSFSREWRSNGSNAGNSGGGVQYTENQKQFNSRSSGNFGDWKEPSNNSRYSNDSATNNARYSVHSNVSSCTFSGNQRRSIGAITNEKRAVVPIFNNKAQVSLREKETLRTMKTNPQSSSPVPSPQASTSKKNCDSGIPASASGGVGLAEQESQQPPDAAELPSPSFLTRNKPVYQGKVLPGDILMRALQSPQRDAQSKAGSRQTSVSGRQPNQHNSQEQLKTPSHQNLVSQELPRDFPMQEPQHGRPQNNHQQHPNQHRPSQQQPMQYQHQQRHLQQQHPNRHHQQGAAHPAGQYWPGGYQGGGGVPASRGGVVEVTHADQVECIVYGTYFNRWSVIRQYGLNRGSSQHFPCLAYDPFSSSKARPSDRGFEIVIYFDVAGCLAEGVKFLVLPAGQVLCSGNANGKVPPHLFDRVLDVGKNQIIFPQPSNRPNISKHSWVDGTSASVSPFMPTQVIKKGMSKGKPSPRGSDSHMKQSGTSTGSFSPSFQESRFASQRSDDKSHEEGQEHTYNPSGASYRKPTRRRPPLHGRLISGSAATGLPQNTYVSQTSWHGLLSTKRSLPFTNFQQDLFRLKNSTHSSTTEQTTK